MNKQINVLLTAIGCPGGVSIIQSLKIDPNIRIIGTDMRTDVLAKYLVDKFYIVLPGREFGYIEEMIKIVKNESIDVILPCATFELDVLSVNKLLFEKHNCGVCVSDWLGQHIANDRHKMSLRFNGESFIPDFAAPENWKEMCIGLKKLGFPEDKVVIKPFISHGSIGLRIVNNNLDVYDQYRNKKPISIDIDFNGLERIFWNKKFDDILMQEYLPGQEWEVDLLLHPNTHKVIAGTLRQQGEVILSASERCILTGDNQILEIGKIMAERLKLSYAINLSIKLDKNGTPKVTEMNPRLGAGTFLPASGGFNLPLLSVYLAVGEEFGLPMVDYGAEMYIYRGYVVFDRKGNLINQTRVKV